MIFLMIRIKKSESTNLQTHPQGADADTNGEDDEGSEETALKLRSVLAEEEVSKTRVEVIVAALKEQSDVLTLTSRAFYNNVLGEYEVRPTDGD